MIVKTLTVSPEAEGLRADVFLCRYLPDLPEHIVRACFSRKDVRRDGVRITRDTRLQAGQEIRVYYSENEASQPLRIIYEDEDVLLVNKQAGISVERDSGGGLSLTDLCADHVRRNRGDAFPPRPCHRLDNKTSGLCLFAKNEKALEILLDVFRRRTMEKEYECLVRGIPKPPRAVCHAWLFKDAKKARVTVYDHPVPGAKEIATGYDTLESGAVSRLRVHLITGRTHQIRAHLSALGHPILGDDLYGDRSLNRARKIRSLCLCAVSLQLDTGGRLPSLDGKRFSVSAPF